jgi:hypothetical protein
MERLCEVPNSIVEDLRHHSWRGSACGKPIPFEAGRAFGTCAFDSRPLRQLWVCWGDWLPYRAVTPGLFGVLRVRILPHPPKLYTRGCSLNGESSRLSIEQMPVRIRSAAPTIYHAVG